MTSQAVATDIEEAAATVAFGSTAVTPEGPRDLAALAPAAAARRRDIEPRDWRRFERYVSEIFTAMGMDLDTPGTEATPTRYLQALYEATAGYEGDPKLMTSFPSETRDAAPSQIIQGPIPFHSLCEHHALPFYGVAHVGYIADGEILGLSKLTRLVRVHARRFTLQERLGEQIAEKLVDLIAPRGVAVYLEASHLCMRMRGVEDHSATVTTAWRGSFSDPSLRHEFLAEVHASKAVR